MTWLIIEVMEQFYLFFYYTTKNNAFITGFYEIGKKEKKSGRA
jgi:hypothetical protein